jgi:hypothetical protein
MCLSISVIARRVAVATVVVLPVAFVALFISPRDQALKNQDQVIRLLQNARPEVTAGGLSRVDHVILSPRVTLVPEQGRSVFGYVIKLHAGSSTFTIEAEPAKPGKTGGFSFFRDEDGIVRFEPELGRPASAKSRQWSRDRPQNER